MSAESRLKTWKKKTISKSELEELMGTASDRELYDITVSAVKDGLLSPIKSSGTNGNLKFPVYLRYRITAAADYADAYSEISVLHPSMTKNRYLHSNPDLYLKYKDALQQLNMYLFSDQSRIEISKKERSFRIFGEEKKLDDPAFSGLLCKCGLTPSVLCFYETPEYCFNDYIPLKKEHMVLLICENKDIWFNIRRRMYEDGASEIFGTHIDGVVYGCGNKISAVGALSEYTRFMDTEAVCYLYWGDIDRAGLNIFLSLKKNNPDMDIALFVPAYLKMLREARGRRIPDSDDHRNVLGDYDGIYRLFPNEFREKLALYINENKRIPQEIISFETLLTDMR